MSNFELVRNTGDLSSNPEAIKELIGNEIEALWKADPTFLAIKARENPNIPLPYFVDFVKKAQLTGADPRLNQIYLVPASKKDPSTNQYIQAANVVFAYQFFMDKASRTGNLDWFKIITRSEKYFSPDKGKEIDTLVSTCWVKRKNMEEVIEYKARYPEFAQNTYVWKNKPYLMLEKCAIANAFRWAFPEALSGIYISEEMKGVDYEGDDKIKKEKKLVKNINPPEIPTEKIDPPKTEDNFEKEFNELGVKIWTAIKILTDNLKNTEKYNEILDNLNMKDIKEMKDKDFEQREAYLDFLNDLLGKNRD